MTEDKGLKRGPKRKDPSDKKTKLGVYVPNRLIEKMGRERIYEELYRMIQILLLGVEGGEIE